MSNALLTDVGIVPMFVAQPPSDAYRPLVIDDHGTDGIIIACDGSDLGMFEDACEAAEAWAITAYGSDPIFDPRNN